MQGFYHLMLLKIMLNQNNTISSKVLKSAKETLDELIEGSATMAGTFNALQVIASETGCPFDSTILSECESLMTAMNRLLYEQESRLKHIQLMQISREKASRFVDSSRKSKVSRQIYTQAI